MHKESDIYKMYFENPYICCSKQVDILACRNMCRASEKILMYITFLVHLLVGKPPEDGNLLAETYVGILQYILYMSLFLSICW
jgi:hypothetical protein